MSALFRAGQDAGLILDTWLFFLAFWSGSPLFLMPVKLSGQFIKIC